jgi:mono/diheme cytochrome c family protein
MKLKLGLVAAFVLAAVSLASIVAVSAADVPAPYTGIKNPFAWADTAAQQAGKQVYQQNCIGCHGATGGNLPTAKFSAATFLKNLEASPDFYFWTISEGRTSLGMPSWKSSLTETQRWQALTYLWTLPSVAAAAAPTPTSVAPTTGSGTSIAPTPDTYTLKLSSSGQAVAGQALSVTVVVTDSLLQPVSNAVVKFQQKVDFLSAQGTVDIGTATTNNLGTAQFSYMPRSTGAVTFTAVYSGSSGNLAMNLSDPNSPLYAESIGVKFPSAGPAIFLGPSVAAQVSYDAAPTKVFRLPGGLFSFLWIPIMVIMLIWTTYFRVMYQVLHIAPKGGSSTGGQKTNTRLLPTIGMVIIVCLGLMLLSMFATGPYSQLNMLGN